MKTSKFLFHPTITSDRDHVVIDNCAAVTIKNNGDDSVTIDDHYLLIPGDHVELNSAVQNIDQILKFEFAGDSSNKKVNIIKERIVG